MSQNQDRKPENKQVENKLDIQDFGDSLGRYMIKHSSWVYMFIIVVLLFGSIYLLGILNQEPAVDSPTNMSSYIEEIKELRKEVNSQDQRIKNLEEQIKLLQTNP
ncbi:hypothetical protein [Granulicatella seriolae]|uniref:Uncharacterized protein n=1 Tax=Granulicatella seriolae TaxID=2967226 RepID=A0ABT1WMY2_9LACT|nr:hypothetical protein [Granulicatella seriolae]